MKNKKLSQYSLSYIDGKGDTVSVLLEARDESHCKQIFRREYGMYFIVKVAKKS